MDRPPGAPSEWSIRQAARWAKHLVREGRVQFDQGDHALDRGHQRGISIDEMLRTVLEGQAKDMQRQELRLRGRHVTEERLTFMRFFASRRASIKVIVALSDAYEDCVIITCMEQK